MPTKIRLSRHGRKRYAFYHIVVADSRAPRDGKMIERIGSYNPNTNPATIELDFNKALKWVEAGAQPSDTTRAILSQEGVLYMSHLLGGVRKGAFDQAEAEKRYDAWKTDKTAKMATLAEKDAQAIVDTKQQLLDAEIKVSEDRAAARAAKLSELAAEATAAVEAELAAKAAAAAAEVPATETEETTEA